MHFPLVLCHLFTSSRLPQEAMACGHPCTQKHTTLSFPDRPCRGLCGWASGTWSTFVLEKQLYIGPERFDLTSVNELIMSLITHKAPDFSCALTWALKSFLRIFFWIRGDFAVYSINKYLLSTY